MAGEKTYSNRAIATTDYILIHDSTGASFKVPWSAVETFVEENLDVVYPNTLTFTLTDPVGGVSAIDVNNTFTKIGAVAHKAIDVSLTYTPSATGAACPIGVVGKVTLNGGFTGNAASSNYPGNAWGVQGQIHVATGSTFDKGTGSGPQILAGLRGVCTDAGTSTYTEVDICAVYAEIQMSQQTINDGANANVYGVWIRNQGSATSTEMAAGLYIDSHTVTGDGANILKGIQIAAGGGSMTTGISIEEATTTGISISGASTTGLNFAGVIPTCIYITGVGTTASHVMDMIDAYVGKFVETGSYASTASKGITLAAGNNRPASFLFDDGGAALGAANYRGVLSRIYLAESQTGQVAIRSIRGQLKVASAKNVNIGSNEMNAVNGVEGYIEMAGTHTVGANTRVAAVHGLLEVNDDITLTSGGYMCGLFAELSQVTAKTVSGIGTVGIIVDRLDSDHTTNQAAWGTGLLIQDSAATTGIDIGSCTTGIDFTGTITDGINFANATPTFGSDNAFIGIGTWTTGYDVASQTEHFVPLQIHLDSNTSVAKDLACARFRVDTDAASTLTSLTTLQLRSSIAHNVAAMAGLNCSVNVDDAVTIQTGELVVGYFSLDGTGALTNAGSNESSALVASVTNTGSTITNGLWIRTAASTTVTNGLQILNGGTMTTGIVLSGTLSTGIDFTDVVITQGDNRENSYISLGHYGSSRVPIELALTKSFAPIQMHFDIQNDGDSGASFRPIWCWTEVSTNDQANTSIYGFMHYVDIQKDVQDVYGALHQLVIGSDADSTVAAREFHAIQATLDIDTGKTLTTTGSYAATALNASLKGAGTITNNSYAIGAALEGAVTGTGCLYLFADTGSTCDHIMKASISATTTVNDGAFLEIVDPAKSVCDKTTAVAGDQNGYIGVLVEDGTTRYIALYTAHA